ncbi:MAG: fibrobacter succinogenes major paralogous domain-containing protein [bacterium]|nr:fibrobacter succinogenes major paralogous domain-containing protein [bacterium]
MSLHESNKFWLYPLILMGFVLFLANGCRKNDKDDSIPTTVTDIDGNVYNIVTIGTQTWMQANLKVTKYNDGTAIPNVTSDSVWRNLTTGGYCWYDNDTGTLHKEFGALYNWYAVNKGKLAPNGWHVSTDAEWTTLKNYLIANGYNYDGTKTGNKIALALVNMYRWATSDNVGAAGNISYFSYSNKSGFSAGPGGYRFDNGFSSWGYNGSFWTSTEQDTNSAVYWSLNYSHDYVSYAYAEKLHGFSVRCVKD